jgi:hypothetical protein
MAAPDEETYLEAGLLAFALMLIGATAALLYGWLAGGALNRDGHRASPPDVGEIPAERHSQIGSNPPR